MDQVSCLKKDIEGRNLKLECVTPEQCVYPVNIQVKMKAWQHHIYLNEYCSPKLYTVNS